jgi:hypothetical protein
MPEQYDYECATCGMMASEHISVTSMCKVLRAVSNRESSLIVEKDKLTRELAAVTEQRDRLAEVIKAATVLIAAKGRHNTMLAYQGLREALAAVEGGQP